MKLNDLLGEAYRQDQMAGSRTMAVDLIKAGIAKDADLAPAAKAELARLDLVVRARGQGGRNGCHVSAVCRDLLTAALG